MNPDGSAMRGLFTRQNLFILLFAAFWFFALFNGHYMKYDYGGGYPVLIVFGVLLPVFMWLDGRGKKERSPVEKLALLIFGVALVLSFIFSQAKAFGFSEVLAYLLAVGFYLIFAYSKNLWQEKFLKVVKISAIAALVLGFYIYLTRGEVRMFGPFFNKDYHSHVWPNAFALFLLMAWPIFLLGKRKVLAITLLLSALLLTYSRGGLIVFFGQIFLLAIYYWRKINLKNAGLILLTGLLAVGIFWGANNLRALQHEVIDVGERAAFGNSESLTSKQERLDFWKGSLELIKQKPWFGWGPYSFREAYNPIQKTFLGSSDHPHNVFLKIGAENGLIALFAYLLFLLAVFVKVVRRFRHLEKGKRDLVYVLGVAVAGAFAHNLIDYNFNFFENLLLLFALIGIIRSTVVMKEERQSAPVRILVIVMALIVWLVVWFEGGILLLQEFVKPSYLELSFFPRYYYSTFAGRAIDRGDLDRAEILLQKQLKLSPLDSQSWYLQGVIKCKKEDLAVCRENFKKALSLNPMNDFVYYYDYLKITDDPEALKKAFELVQQYFEYVEYNVHFTGYTNNVEAASRLIDILMRRMPKEQWNGLVEKRQRMLEKAKMLRETKTF